MLLFEHPDFEQAILAAEAHYAIAGLHSSIIEKDYYVTESLRALAQLPGGKIIFKGGTSLSKGWNLIQRFSEDIDIFLDPESFTPPLGKSGIDRELKKLRDAITNIPALTHLPNESQTIGGFGRCDRFFYKQLFGGAGQIANRVLLEAGTASGRQPTQVVALQSIVGKFLQEKNLSLGCDDEVSFDMTLLHFRRTFVEKMFAIHSKVVRFKYDATPIGKYARHYYDLYQLAGQTEVINMLQSDEYVQIKTDYDKISSKYFARDYKAPTGMSFANSDAIFPIAELAKHLRRDYDRECGSLCYGKWPAWPDVLDRFESIKKFL